LKRWISSLYKSFLWSKLWD